MGKKTFKGNTVKEQNRLVARAVFLLELKELEWGRQGTRASHPKGGATACLSGSGILFKRRAGLQESEMLTGITFITMK